jgi:hypothetical protein
LVARSLCDKFARSSLPSFRLHWFFRNIEGLWACTMPGCQCRENEMGERTAGKLFGGNRILCGNPVGAHRVLELLYCEQCGTTFFGGSRLSLPANSGWELLSTDPDIEGIPDRQAARFVDRRNYDEFAVFWPVGSDSLHGDADSWRQPSLSNNPAIPASWTRASLQTSSGVVKLGDKKLGFTDGILTRYSQSYLSTSLTTSNHSYTSCGILRQVILGLARLKSLGFQLCERGGMHHEEYICGIVGLRWIAVRLEPSCSSSSGA